MNDTTKWIMIALLLLLIAAAVIVLLRSPGKDRDGGDDTLDRGDDDRESVQGGHEERLGGGPERGVYDQEADHRAGGAHVVTPDDREVHDDRGVRDEPVAAAEPSTYDRPATQDQPTADDAHVDDEGPVVDEAPSQEPPAAAVAGQASSVDDSVTYADDIEATTGPEAAADRDATGDDEVAAEPYQPAAGAYEGGEPGTSADQSYRPDDSAPVAQPGTEVEQHPTEELTAGDTEGYGGPAEVADTTASGGPTPVTGDSAADTGDVSADDDADRQTEAARIGALGAAGGAVGGAATTGAGSTAARPLSDEEVSAGARHEPLEVDAQEHPDGTTTSADEVPPAGRAHDEGQTAWETDDDRTDERPATRTTHDEALTDRTDERPAVEETSDDSTTHEPLTADEVVAASDEGRGWSQDPATEPTTGATAAGARGAGYETVDEPGHVTEEPASGVEHEGTTEASPVFAESVYGPGSADPLDDGTGPAGWVIKGNVGSMLFHTTDSPSYDAVRAEVWFESEEAARNAGFAHWDRRRR